jgi:ABC-type multidrug transport system fused ATPase/permease subunit
MRNLAAQFHASADGVAVADRLLDLAGPVPGRARGATPPDPSLVSIRLDRVSYVYPGSDMEVLCDVDLEIRPGETIALVGPSGVGKSTLLALLLGLLELSSGRIGVGDADLGELDARRWRALTAFVPQHPTLFRGTVAENIRLGDPEADANRVRSAAELAGAHDFVARLPLAYETVMGDGSRRLSAGQRRRIGLARAFVRDAPLVLLDEPTADLDPASVEVVVDALTRLRERRRTVVLVTHAPAVISCADRVVEFARGRMLDPAQGVA